MTNELQFRSDVRQLSTSRVAKDRGSIEVRYQVLRARTGLRTTEESQLGLNGRPVLQWLSSLD